MALAQNRVPNRVGVKTLRADYAQVYELNTQKADEIVRLREQLRLAVEALKPFAEHANWYDGAIGHVSEDDYQFCAAVGAEWCGIHRLNLGHLRQARAALRASGVDLGGKGG